jgi:cation transporter-like permease
MTHMVFSLHLYTFLLLLFCVAMLAAKLSSLLGFGGIESSVVDNVLSSVNFLACVAYLYMAIGPVYGTVGVMRGLQAIVLTVAVAAIVLGYRFVLFLITLYAT